MREYLLGVICAAFLCALAGAIGGEGRGLRKWAASLFLVLTLLRPLGLGELPEFTIGPYLEEAEAAAQAGAEQAQDARNEIISAALEAYILTKAAELDLELEAAVTVHPDGTPDRVELSGAASPAERETLTRILTKELGIGREELRWSE